MLNVAGESPKIRIGILALQGDASLHIEVLQELQVTSAIVKTPNDLKGLDGLIMPGGESTALLKLMKPIGMLEAIKDFAEQGKQIFGTCAGAILLASKVTHPEQESLGLIDITIKRNGYGRQRDSQEAVGKGVKPLPKDLPMTFIRAPRITAVSESMEVLATYQNDPVLVQSKNILAATFHPELTDDLSVYKYWLSQF